MGDAPRPRQPRLHRQRRNRIPTERRAGLQAQHRSAPPGPRQESPPRLCLHGTRQRVPRYRRRATRAGRVPPRARDPAEGDRGSPVRPGRLEADVERPPFAGRLSAGRRGAQRAEAARSRRSLRRGQRSRHRGSRSEARRRGSGMKKKKKTARRGAASERAVARARESVQRAGRKLTDRLAQLERVADAIEAAAVERFQSAAVRELAEDQLLRDLGDLQAAFGTKEAGGLPGDIEPFRHLPEAVLRWMQAQFGLTPYLEAGKVMQVPSDKLDNFALTRDRGDAPSGLLVRLRVLAPGWKRGGKVVVP